MKQDLIKFSVRARFLLTHSKRASIRIRKLLDQYLALAHLMGPEAGHRQVRVPPMMGVDEDMRDWSFFMILEHNVIVNHSITEMVQRLARGEKPAGTGAFDPKRDVMPSPNPGEEQVQALRASVNKHIDIVSHLSDLRRTATSRHPFFGYLNAHGWHCMFSLHLDIHLRQAQVVSRLARQGQYANH